MIFIGIAFVLLIVVICLVTEDRDDRIGLAGFTAFIGVCCVFAAFIVKYEETTDAVNLYKQGLLKEEITITQTTENGKTKIDTLYTYSRPKSRY